MYLAMYDDTHQTAIDNYCLSEKKLRYVREPKIALTLTKKDPKRHAVLVFEGEYLVAFMTLFEATEGSPYSDNNSSLLVQDLSTDYRHLRNGYIKQAVELLPSFIRQHFSMIDQLIIVVNEDKAFTQALRLEAGFKDTGNDSLTYGSQVYLQIPI
ncbi:GNAT family acetyltransferase [Enterococcus silesiacus]|uniref:GNAT family acetyltransferase n=1 Tax=Enterococcus silesiacus TaxID=332949 RepID=A0A0S3KEX6_9ENTE|nr:GNAT family N-acetyltransferase [Enterococcus silesiacus]ALS02601.1 GNAT family acetyltransferase [Enterococcus silesiacus]OJG93474.1 hypothetical protein RV15_GL000076 [Enterococcus silesiacus]